MSSIPLLDLSAQYDSLKKEIDQAIFNVIHQSQFIGGEFVHSFEDAFAKYLDIKHCVSCGNGTDALEIALSSLNIGPGDEVIVPSLTWISTAEAVSNVGAAPIFAEIEPTYYGIDPLQILKKITPKTKAIIPVHLYGHPADMNAIISIAKENKLFVIEDAAQAHGAEIEGKKVGTFGDLATFSFYPGKNLGAFGDGGCIVTKDATLADTCRRLSNHGQLKKHQHEILGRNSRLDAIQASVLSAKLPHLDHWNKKRRENAKAYRELIKNQDVILPSEKEHFSHVYHCFVIRFHDRKTLIEKFNIKGIGYNIHYPNPLPYIKPYVNTTKASFTRSKKISAEIITIPNYPEMNDDQIELISNTINQL
jgi:dTDP-4-amino-4,6-dideoxygalactose transaminase